MHGLRVSTVRAVLGNHSNDWKTSMKGFYLFEVCFAEILYKHII